MLPKVSTHGQFDDEEDSLSLREFIVIEGRWWRCFGRGWTMCIRVDLWLTTKISIFISIFGRLKIAYLSLNNSPSWTDKVIDEEDMSTKG